ncbi:hypothetical protein ASE00_07230 [Sphingomonas sp. Root710]|uniref:response regulator n=1 Tax=Sphingomonas sp. Root710 TaxID=1736594 RepID=UPI0007023CE0|nr:response regulator [Sphingomonas sp. Root710]KRB86483.1 hypothetical protein ASE00_07230 [Sphingomonas sp. Root710]
MKILCVDDDFLTLQVTADLLRELGHHVLESTDGRSALDLTRQAAPPIDLLITDILMPDMDGTTLASKARMSMPGLPVVYMTGLPVKPGGEDPVVAKPCSLGALSDAILIAGTRPSLPPSDDDIWRQLVRLRSLRRPGNRPPAARFS